MAKASVGPSTGKKYDGWTCPGRSRWPFRLLLHEEILGLALW